MAEIRWWSWIATRFLERHCIVYQQEGAQPIATQPNQESSPINLCTLTLVCCHFRHCSLIFHNHLLCTWKGVYMPSDSGWAHITLQGFPTPTGWWCVCVCQKTDGRDNRKSVSQLGDHFYDGGTVQLYCIPTYLGRLRYPYRAVLYLGSLGALMSLPFKSCPVRHLVHALGSIPSRSSRCNIGVGDYL